MTVIDDLKKTRGTASARRSMSRGLPFQLAAASALGTLILVVPGPAGGLWVFFGMDFVLAVLLVWSFIRSTQELTGTRPEQRGKRSDDKALAKSQRSVGCLPILLAIAVVGTLFGRGGNARVATAAWYVAFGGFLGHVVGVALIQWARTRHAE